MQDLSYNNSKIAAEDRSELGLLIFKYMDREKLTFDQMANYAKVSCATLIIACLKGGRLSKKTTVKLASALEISEEKIRSIIEKLICEN